ncbi:MAG: hypothetical protein AAB444_00995 [Patescibacteria group bacterium]
MTITRQRKGYALLVALLVTTTIVAGSAALARVIIANLRQNQYVDRATTALVAASSGLEQGLFLVRRLERVPAPGAGTTIAGVNNGIQVSVSTRINDDLAEASRFSISRDDSITLDIPTNASLGSISIPAWTPEEGCTSSWIETALSSWGGSGFSVNRHLHSLVDAMDAPVTLEVPVLDSTRVELRVKSLYCDIKRLEVVALSGGNTVPLPARVVIDSVGEYFGSRQALRAVLPARPPLSGVFDFVLYSGSKLEK